MSRRARLPVLIAVVAAVLLSGAFLFMNAWWLALEGAANICLARDGGNRGVSTPREGLGFRCVYEDGPRTIRGSKVWIWQRS